MCIATIMMYTCVTGSSSQRTSMAHLNLLSLVLTYLVHKMCYVDYYDNTSESVVIPTKKPVISEDTATPTYGMF